MENKKHSITFGVFSNSKRIMCAKVFPVYKWLPKERKIEFLEMMRQWVESTLREANNE